MNLFDRNRLEDVDEIDAALNALMSDASYQPAGQETVSIVDTHRMAMSAVRNEPAAQGPAAGTWNRVLRATTTATVQPVSKGREEMTTATWVGSNPTSLVGRNERERGRLFRSVSIAATLAIVSLLAFGGWFANSYFRLDPDQGPRLAVLGLQPSLAGNGVCDVEPLTVDEVLSLTNPFALMGLSEEELEERGFPLSDYRDNLRAIANRNSVAAMGLPDSLISSGQNPAADDKYTGYADVANEYLDCLTNGTVGQVWRFIDPVRVQWRLTQWLPFMVTDEEARVLLPEIIELPANDVWAGSETLLEGVIPQVSASAEDAFVPVTSFRDHFDYIVVTPILYVESLGMEIEAGTPVTFDGKPMTRNLVMGRSVLDGGWYVIGVYDPEP